MTTKKIMVTGGAGFIGSHVVDKYVSLGHEVVVVDDLTTGKKEHINPKAKFYKIDLRDKRGIAKVINREKPEIINHQAAQKSVSHSVDDPIHDAEINIIGFLNLMEAAKSLGVKKIVFASTGGAIYGDAKEIPTPESCLPQPVSPYAITKFTTEQYLRFYLQTARITPVILRYSNVYGPRQDPFGEAGVVAIFSKLMSEGKPLTVFGDGKQTRDYVFVEDVATASVKALQYQPNNFDSAVINIGTGIETPLNGIITLLEKASGGAPPTGVGGTSASATPTEASPFALRATGGLPISPSSPSRSLRSSAKVGKKADIKHQPARAGDLLRSAIDINKANKLLGWKPEVALENGIEKTYRFFDR